MFLEGIQVLDFTSLLPGPYATLRLAELGAHIIKIEPLRGGDAARGAGPQLGGDGAVFLANNRNKHSLALDLKSDAGKAKALELARRADVIIEGFRPGVTTRLGIGYDDIRIQNPGVVYCSLTGYGQTGPFRDVAGHDLNYLSASGVLSLLRDKDERPVVPAFQLADQIGGIVAVEAILAALFARQQSGDGAYLDVAMTDALMGMLNTHTVAQSLSAGETGLTECAGEVICYNLYETQDHRYVSICALESKFWRNFCEAVGKPDWIAEAFSHAVPENPVYVDMKALFLQHPAEFWGHFGDVHDVCLQVVLSVSEAVRSVHAVDRGIVRTLRSSCGALPYVDTHVGGHGRERPDPTWPPKLGKNSEDSGHQSANGREI